MARNEETRPKVLDNASETQIDELERQFDQNDREGWRTLTESYGWTSDQSKDVWDWFSQDPGKKAV